MAKSRQTAPSKKPAAKSPAAKNRPAKKPAKQPAAKKPAAKKPAKQPAAKKPAAKNRPAKQPVKTPARRAPATRSPPRADNELQPPDELARTASPAPPAVPETGETHDAPAPASLPETTTSQLPPLVMPSAIPEEPRPRDVDPAATPEASVARRARSQTLEPDIISVSPILPPRHERPRTVPPRPPPTRRSKAYLPPPSEIDEGWDLEPAPESSPAHPLRGLALVEKVIEKMEADGGRLGGCGIPDHPATPMLWKEILHLSLPGGRHLPPSLERFLEYDETFLGVVEGEPPRLKLRTFREMLVEEFDEATADRADFGNLLPGACLVVPGGTDSRRFIYFGEPDEHGEYPVMVVDVDDIPYVCIAYPGLDVYLADGVLTTVLKQSYLDGFDGPYGPELVAQARRNFHGFKSFDLDGGDVEHVDGPSAVRPLLEQLFGPTA